MPSDSHSWHAVSQCREVVYCHICGLGWDQADPAVRWLNIDRAWSCADEAACFDRRAMAGWLQPGNSHLPITGTGLRWPE